MGKIELNGQSQRLNNLAQELDFFNGRRIFLFNWLWLVIMAVDTKRKMEELFWGLNI